MIGEMEMPILTKASQQKGGVAPAASGRLMRPPLRPCFPPSGLDTNQQLDMGLSLELSVCSPTLYEPCDPAGGTTQPLASPCTPLLCAGTSTTNLSSGLDFSFDLAPAFEESTALSFLPLDMERSALLGSGVNHPSNDPDDDKQASFISELDSWTGLTSNSLDDKTSLGGGGGLMGSSSPIKGLEHAMVTHQRTTPEPTLAQLNCDPTFSMFDDIESIIKKEVEESDNEEEVEELGEKQHQQQASVMSPAPAVPAPKWPCPITQPPTSAPPATIQAAYMPAKRVRRETLETLLLAPVSTASSPTRQPAAPAISTLVRPAAAATAKFQPQPQQLHCFTANGTQVSLSPHTTTILAPVQFISPPPGGAGGQQVLFSAAPLITATTSANGGQQTTFLATTAGNLQQVQVQQVQVQQQQQQTEAKPQPSPVTETPGAAKLSVPAARTTTKRRVISPGAARSGRSSTASHGSAGSMERQWEEILELIHDDDPEVTTATGVTQPPPAKKQRAMEADAGGPLKDVAYTPTDTVESQGEEDDYDSDGGCSDAGNASDNDSVASHSSFVDDFIAAGRKEKRYFWQYNMQSKGPKGKRLCKQVDSLDPHVLNDFEDPVFDPELNQMKYKHNGKARRGDGNDITPNPRKLFNIGTELNHLNKQINCMTPVSELPVPARSTSRKEKNKYASRACRLKKKAQHEANKLKLHGLEREHNQLMLTLASLKHHILTTLDQPALGGGIKREMTYTEKLDSLIKTNLKSMIAGNTADYVNSVLERIGAGDNTGGIYDDEPVPASNRVRHAVNVDSWA